VHLRPRKADISKDIGRARHYSEGLHSTQGACLNYAGVLHDTRIASWHRASSHCFTEYDITSQHITPFLSRYTGFSSPR
jgi:hypothetical protein